MEDLKIHETNEFLGGTESDELFAHMEQTVEECSSNENSQDTTASGYIEKNFDFYNTLQNVTPYTPRGGNNNTHSNKQAFAKRRKHNKMQKNSRRINRKK